MSHHISEHSQPGNHYNQQNQQNQNKNVGLTPTRGIIYRMESPNPYNRPVLNSPQNICRRR